MHARGSAFSSTVADPTRRAALAVQPLGNPFVFGGPSALAGRRFESTSAGPQRRPGPPLAADVPVAAILFAGRLFPDGPQGPHLQLLDMSRTARGRKPQPPIGQIGDKAKRHDDSTVSGKHLD